MPKPLACVTLGGDALRCNRGSTAAEFALLAPLLFLTLTLVIQVGLSFAVRIVLDDAVSYAERQVRIAPATKTVQTVATVTQMICDRSLGLVDCRRLSVSLTRAADPGRSACQYSTKCTVTRRDLYVPYYDTDIMTLDVSYAFSLFGPALYGSNLFGSTYRSIRMFHKEPQP